MQSLKEAQLAMNKMSATIHQKVRIGASAIGICAVLLATGSLFSQEKI